HVLCGISLTLLVYKEGRIGWNVDSATRREIEPELRIVSNIKMEV
ncbi:1290_t:CDS:2, partial [Dentiscutata erythropus]